ncbi:MAG TPA: ATP-binding protein, partial [Phycisphaerales bacterium]|nr:ATP-binding protein [Phycisphaerales bacterium]
PMYSEKRLKGATGIGLGLAVSHQIVEQHGGRIDASSEGVGCGSRFVVELPAVTFTTEIAR